MTQETYSVLRGTVIVGLAYSAIFGMVLAATMAFQRRSRGGRDAGLDADSARWLLVEYDDGVRIYLSSAAGGAAPEGEWGTLSLMRTGADGHVTFRRFAATGPWAPGEITHMWIDEAKDIDPAAVSALAKRQRDQNVRMPRL